MSCEVNNMQIQPGEGVGGLSPIPQCRREVTPRVPPHSGCSSFSGGWRGPSWGWLGVYCPTLSGGGSSKAIAALSLGGIMVVFGMVVWPVAQSSQLYLFIYSLYYYYLFHISCTLLLHFKNKIAICPIMGPIKDLSKGFFFFFFVFRFASVSIHMFTWLLICIVCLFFLVPLQALHIPAKSINHLTIHPYR